VRKIFAILFSAFAISAQAQDISGAGATFPAPLYSKWADTYNKETGIKVNYQSIGSGAGIKQITAKTVVFGASDMPLTDEKLVESNLFQFPVVIGGVVPVVNLKNVKPGDLKLTGNVLADIYLGKITKWNDKSISDLNPGIDLPDTTIAVVRRADGSGTSFIFTNYLSKVSDEWKTKVGEGTAVNWPTGAGGKGNEGVSAFIQRLPNSIGYVEYAYAKQNNLTYVSMKNASGSWVLPSELGFKAAAIDADWNKSYYQILTNRTGANVWPISGVTFILINLKSDNVDLVKSALKFVDWAYTKGDNEASALNYVPLPESVKNKVRSDWKKLGLN